MTIEPEKLVERLCSYDPRNPGYADLASVLTEDGDLKRHEGCACDNCFYGRHELADALLAERAKHLTPERVYELWDEIKRVTRARGGFLDPRLYEAIKQELGAS